MIKNQTLGCVWKFRVDLDHSVEKPVMTHFFEHNVWSNFCSIFRMSVGYKIGKYDFEYDNGFDFVLFSITILNLVSYSSWKLFHNKAIFQSVC